MINESALTARHSLKRALRDYAYYEGGRGGAAPAMRRGDTPSGAPREVNVPFATRASVASAHQNARSLLSTWNAAFAPEREREIGA